MALLPCLLLLLVSATCTAIPLLQGRFETTTDVQDYLNLAIDAAEMREATDLAVKKSIYQNVSRCGVVGGLLLNECPVGSHDCRTFFRDFKVILHRIVPTESPYSH